MSNQLLRDTDQMSMAHALEVRVPLLDDHVVGATLSLPSGVRTAPGKSLLARASGLDGLLTKRPFVLPFDQWMRGPLQQTVREALLSDSLPLADLMGASLRRRLWAAFQEHRVHWSRPWAVGVVRLWAAANGLGS
jgi:asparagine synthase (glutamine-hydrolysing)